MGVFTNHAKVTKVACPKCGAQIGEAECRGIFGVHDERWHLVFPPPKKAEPKQRRSTVTRCVECGKVQGFCLCAVRRREAEEAKK